MICWLCKQRTSLHFIEAKSLTHSNRYDMKLNISIKYSSVYHNTFSTLRCSWERENENDTCGANLSTPTTHHKETMESLFHSRKKRQSVNYVCWCLLTSTADTSIIWQIIEFKGLQNKWDTLFFICMALWAESGMLWTAGFFPWLKPGSWAAHCTKEKIMSTGGKSLRPPVSVCGALSGSWQRETPCCTKAATPLTLQKTKNLTPKARDQGNGWWKD